MRWKPPFPRNISIPHVIDGFVAFKIHSIPADVDRSYEDILEGMLCATLDEIQQGIADPHALMELDHA